MNKQSEKTDKRVLQFLRNNPSGITRDVLSRKAKIPRSTVFDALKRLEAKNMVYYRNKLKVNHRNKGKDEINQERRGRRKIVWVYIPQI